MEFQIHYVKSAQIRSFSGPYFPVLELNTEIYSVNHRIQSEYRKIRTGKNSLFKHILCSDSHSYLQIKYGLANKKNITKNAWDEDKSKDEEVQVAVAWKCSVKRCSLKFIKIHRKTPVPEACHFIKKETLTQVFSCGF